jgi:hypothetical protein
MLTNFIALIPFFKSERSWTFLLACDAVGLYWLRDRFLQLVDSKPDASFVIGDGLGIASDGRCVLIVEKARNHEPSVIERLSQINFTWRINSENAAQSADKILTLAISNFPGHQYFDLDRGRFHTVVITKDEYPVETIRAMRDGRPPPAR